MTSITPNLFENDFHFSLVDSQVQVLDFLWLISKRGQNDRTAFAMGMKGGKVHK